MPRHNYFPIYVHKKTNENYVKIFKKEISFIKA